MNSTRIIELTVAQNENTVYLAMLGSMRLRELLDIIPKSRLKIINKRVTNGYCIYEVRLRGVNYAK